LLNQSSQQVHADGIIRGLHQGGFLGGGIDAALLRRVEAGSADDQHRVTVGSKRRVGSGGDGNGKVDDGVAGLEQRRRVGG